MNNVIPALVGAGMKLVPAFGEVSFRVYMI